MNNIKSVLLGLLPLALLLVIGNQIVSMSNEFKRPTPNYQLSYESLEAVVKQTELASKLTFEQVDSTFEKSISTPFGKTVRSRRKRTYTPKYERSSISLQGVLQGDSPLAVLVDPKGKTHIVKRGETILDRKVIKPYIIDKYFNNEESIPTAST